MSTPEHATPLNYPIRDVLADRIAFHLFGKDMDNCPIGHAVLATTGHKIALPIADAVLDCPGITYTGSDS